MPSLCLIKPESFRIWQTPRITVQGWLRFLTHGEQVCLKESLRKAGSPQIHCSLEASPELSLALNMKVIDDWFQDPLRIPGSTYAACSNLLPQVESLHINTHTLLYTLIFRWHMPTKHRCCVTNDYNRSGNNDKKNIPCVCLLETQDFLWIFSMQDWLSLFLQNSEAEGQLF